MIGRFWIDFIYGCSLEMIELPKNCLVNSPMPKNLFYKELKLSNKDQQLFVDLVDRILWLYKLSEDTIWIKPTKDVSEIEIFEITLKEKTISERLLYLLSKVPYKMLLVLRYKDDFCYSIATRTEDWIEKFNTTKWNEEIKFEFSWTNLEYVYQNIVKAIIKQEDNQELSFEEIIQVKTDIEETEKQLEKVTKKLNSEKQPDRQLPLNQEKNRLKKILDKLKNLLHK